MNSHRFTPPAVPRRRFLGRALALLAGGALLPRRVEAQASTLSSDPFLGEIMIFGGNFPPRGWATCDGQLLPIAQNQALFSLLGTTYGGNGVTTFALPDLRGRVPIHYGQGPGLAPHTLGERGGEESHTLTAAEMPAHTHVGRGSSAVGTSAVPGGNVVARNAAQIPQYSASADTSLAPGAIGSAGGGIPHNNMQPYLAVQYVIALVGFYPSP